MRYGAVSYLNSRPLLEGLSPIVLETPARLAERFQRGEIDVALLPVAAGETLGVPRIGDLGICADGAVESVLLFLRCPLARVRTLALDPASRTSRILAEVVLREAHGLHPAIVQGSGDAELVIGDAALVRGEGPEPRIDLAEAWAEMTGLPFVFAAWYGDPAADGVLRRAFTRGIERIPAYVAAAGLPLPPERLDRYLRERIRYRIGPREREGLLRFLDLGRRLGLL